MKKKTFLLGAFLCSAAAISASVAIVSPTSFSGGDATECNHKGNHYLAREAGAEKGGCKEYWACCNCHEHFVGSAPSGTWDEAGTAFVEVDSSDDRYVKPHLVYNLGFEGNTPLADVSGSDKGYAATEGTGGLTYVDGPTIYNGETSKTIKAVNVPTGTGPSAYIKLPWAIANNEAVTLSYWSYIPANDVTPYRWYMDVFCNGGWRYAWQFDNNDFWKGVRPCLILNGGWAEAPAAPAPSANLGVHAPESGILNMIMGGWTHIAYSFTSTGINVYQNGTHVVTYAGNYSMKRLYDVAQETASGIYLGGSLWGDSNLGGKIADVRVYDKALSATEVKEIPGVADYRNFKTSDYQFADMFDAVKTNADGSKVGFSLLGNAKVEDGNLVLPTNDNNYDRIGAELSPTIMSGSRELTVRTKFKLDTLADWRHVFEISMNSTTFITLYAHNGSFQLKAANKNDVWQEIITTNFAPVVGEWYEAALVCSNSGYALYINNTLIGTGSMAFNNSIYHDCLCNAEALKVRIGCSASWDAKNNLNGVVDYFTTYAYALTAAQLAAL